MIGAPVKNSMHYPIGHSEVRTISVSFPEGNIPAIINEEIIVKVIWQALEAIQPPLPNMPWLFKSSLHRLRVMEKPGEIWLWDNKGLSLYLNFYRGTGEAQIASERNWQDVLRVSYFFKFLERRGLLLHASGLVRRGRAFLFPGETRAGKTTIVRQSPGVSVLSDEMPAVRLLENGGAPLAYGTPLFGSWGRPGENLSAPLRGFYFPVKAIENRLTPIAPSKALSLLIQRVCSFTTWEPRLRQLVQLTEELVQRVPSFILEFRPRPDFWQVIDGT